MIIIHHTPTEDPTSADFIVIHKWKIPSFPAFNLKNT